MHIISLLPLICMYDDDIILCTSDMQYMVEIKNRFLDRYDMTDMGRLTSFLNIRAVRPAKIRRKGTAGLVGTSSKKNPCRATRWTCL